jgi:hypothetical protein
VPGAQEVLAVAERAAALAESAVAGEDESAFAGPDDLAVLEAEAAEVAGGSQVPAACAGAVGLAGVLLPAVAEGTRQSFEQLRTIFSYGLVCYDISPLP